MNELVSVSLRIPKRLNDDLEQYVQEGKYASKTEVLREALRALLYQQVDGMTGALKGKVGAGKGTLSQTRKREWGDALKKAGGDVGKALGLLDAEERKAASKFRF